METEAMPEIYVGVSLGWCDSTRAGVAIDDQDATRALGCDRSGDRGATLLRCAGVYRRADRGGVAVLSPLAARKHGAETGWRRMIEQSGVEIGTKGRRDIAIEK